MNSTVYYIWFFVYLVDDPYIFMWFGLAQFSDLFWCGVRGTLPWGIEVWHLALLELGDVWWVNWILIRSFVWTTVLHGLRLSVVDKSKWVSGFVAYNSMIGDSISLCLATTQRILCSRFSLDDWSCDPHVTRYEVSFWAISTKSDWGATAMGNSGSMTNRVRDWEMSGRIATGSGRFLSSCDPS